MPKELSSSQSFNISFEIDNYKIPDYTAPGIDYTAFDHQTAKVTEYSELVFGNFSSYQDYEQFLSPSSESQMVSSESWMWPISQNDEPQPSYDFHETSPIQQNAGSVPSAVVVPLEQMLFSQESFNQSNPFLLQSNTENIAHYENNLTRVRELEADQFLIESERKKSRLENIPFLLQQVTPMRTKWTAEKDQILWNLKHIQNLDWDQVCLIMKDSSFNSLQYRYRELQQQFLPLESKVKKDRVFVKEIIHWNKEEETRLVQFVAERKDWPEIGKLLNRTPDAARLHHQAIVKKNRQQIANENVPLDTQIKSVIPVRHWSEEEITKLLLLRTKERSWKIIGDQLDRSPHSVRIFYKRYTAKIEKVKTDN